MQVEPPAIDLIPRTQSVPYRKQIGPVFGDVDRHMPLLEYAHTLQQKPDKMHCVFPLDIAGRTQVLLQFLELRHDVSVIGLEDKLRKKDAATLEDRVRNLGCVLHKRGEETFENVGVSLQRQSKELLQLPVALLRLFIFKLLRYAIKRPLKIGGRQINASAIHIGVFATQPISSRSNDAAINNEAVQAFVLAGQRSFPYGAALNLLQDGEGASRNVGFRAIGKAYTIGVRRICGTAHNLCYRASRVRRRVCAQHDLCTQRHDKLRRDGGRLMQGRKSPSVRERRALGLPVLKPGI